MARGKDDQFAAMAAGVCRSSSLSKDRLMCGTISSLYLQGVLSQHESQKAYLQDRRAVLGLGELVAMYQQMGILTHIAAFLFTSQVSRCQ